MFAEKRRTAPTAPAHASKGGSWQTLTLSVAQWPIATRIVLLSLLPLLALGMAGGLWLRGQMQQALWGGFDQALQEKAQRVAARLQLGQVWVPKRIQLLWAVLGACSSFTINTGRSALLGSALCR